MIFWSSIGDTSLCNCSFIYFSQKYNLSKAAGGIYGDVNVVGNEASDKMWVHVCKYASLFAEWHMLQEAS